MDFLEPMIALDETHYQDGYKDGYDDGMVSGKEEGRQVGLKLGFQDMMKEIRLKFRVITGSLGAKLGYEGRPTSSEQDLEDI
uniref:Essential protein Yae1 N-terminal domain-containing protein n=1 Tax=Aegilops tauschii subsp. strangulata TaxID=200361 RepID=A0A453GJX5_AEGTS